MLFNYKSLIFISSLALLYGCGENNFSAGVSLGGSGTGLGGGQNPNPPLASNPPKEGYPSIPPDILPSPPILSPIENDISNPLVTLYLSGKIIDYCGIVERTLQLEDPKTGELIEKELAIHLEHISQYDFQNFIVHINVKNLTYKNIYEYTDQCFSPISLINHDVNKAEKNGVSCPDQQQISLIKPNETKSYRYQFKLDDVGEWKVVYDAKYAIDHPDQLIDECTASQLVMYGINHRVIAPN